MADPVVIEHTIQEADNGYIVVSRQSGQQIGLTVLANEHEVGAHIANLTRSKAQNPKSIQADVPEVDVVSTPVAIG